MRYDHLIGIPFTHIGDRDCFELVRDFNRDNFGIHIPNFARPHDWKSSRHDLIREYYQQTEFEMLTRWKPTDLRPGDILAIMINEPNPNHLAIVVDDAQILHHLYGRMSNVEPIRGYWLHNTAFVMRHPEVPDLRPVYPDVEIESILRERNSPPRG